MSTQSSLKCPSINTPTQDWCGAVCRAMKVATITINGIPVHATPTVTVMAHTTTIRRITTIMVDMCHSLADPTPASASSLWHLLHRYPRSLLPDGNVGVQAPTGGVIVEIVPGKTALFTSFLINITLGAP